MHFACARISGDKILIGDVHVHGMIAYTCQMVFTCMIQNAFEDLHQAFMLSLLPIHNNRSMNKSSAELFTVHSSKSGLCIRSKMSVG